MATEIVTKSPTAFEGAVADVLASGKNDQCDPQSLSETRDCSGGNSMTARSFSLDVVDAINERLYKAGGIAALLRTSEGNATEDAITNSAWTIEGLLEEVHTLVNGDGKAAEATS